MNEAKKARVERAALEAKARMHKHILSLHHCLVRSDVMRHHHDNLVHEMLETEDPAAFNDVKKCRFSAYIAFWFAGLTGVIERYEELREKGVIPRDNELDGLITDDFKDVVKPFRNSVAHCSDHDDRRTLEIFNHEATIPDQATKIAEAFHRYFSEHSERNA